MVVLGEAAGRVLQDGWWDGAAGETVTRRKPSLAEEIQAAGCWLPRLRIHTEM